MIGREVEEIMCRPCSLLVIALLVISSLAIASATFADEKQTYQERLEYDPATGQWKEIAPPIPGTEEGDLALGRSLLARGEYKEARKAFAQWFKMYPDSPHRSEALFYAAETEITSEDVNTRTGDLIRAHEWLSEVLEGWSGTDLGERALRKEIILAEMILFKNRKQKVWKGMMWLSAHEEALAILDRVIDDWARDTPIAEHALRLKADYHYINGEFQEAELAYARLVRDFPRGRYHKLAMLRSGESAFARFPGVEFDEADLLEAEVYLNDFQQRYPEDAVANSVPQLLTRVRESRAQKDFTVAEYYERTKHLESAAYYYRSIDRTYPGTTWAAQARSRLIAIGAMEPPPENADFPSEEQPPASQPVADAEQP